MILVSPNRGAKKTACRGGKKVAMENELTAVTLNALQQTARSYGADLKKPQSLLPINMDLNAKTEFARGVLACAAYVYASLSDSTQGRQAIRNLGFEPLLQNIEGPGCTGP